MLHCSIPTKHCQRGSSRGKTVQGLAIVIASVVIGLAAFSQSKTSQGGNEARDQITQVLSAVRKIYPGPTYTGVTSISLVNRGVVSSSMSNGTNLVNIYGGTVTLASASVAGGTDNSVTIFYPQVPRTDCGVLVTQIHQLFGRVVIGSTTIKDHYGVTVTSFNGDDLDSACNSERNAIAMTATE